MKVFDFIKKHQYDEHETCECVILPDGTVEEPEPSHIVKLVELSLKPSVWLHAHMEKGMEPLYWVVEYTGCLSVWQTRVVAPSKMTKEQEEALEELKNGAMLSPLYLLQQPEQEYIVSVLDAKKEEQEKKDAYYFAFRRKWKTFMATVQ